MKTTFELLEKYLLSILTFKELELDDYSINGSIIKLQYSYEYSWSENGSRSYDNYVEVELLDYITFLFNFENINKKS